MPYTSSCRTSELFEGAYHHHWHIALQVASEAPIRGVEAIPGSLGDTVYARIGPANVSTCKREANLAYLTRSRGGANSAI